jgi:predicted DNA-binding transcriptional regulator YafY
VQDIRVLDEEFTRPPDFDMGQFWRESSRAVERSLSTFPVTLRVKRGGAALLREVLGSIGDNALRQARRYEDGTSEVRVPFESADQARRYLLGLADVIEVVEPEGVRQSMALGAAVALRMYGPASRGALLGRSRHSWEEIDHE